MTQKPVKETNVISQEAQQQLQHIILLHTKQSADVPCSEQMYCVYIQINQGHKSSLRDHSKGNPFLLALS